MDELPTNVLAAFLGASNNSNRALNIMIGSGIDSDYNRVLATSLNDESPVRNVLSEDGEEQIKTRKFTKDDECDTCPIFHIPFEEGDDVKELPCGHIFTPEGIDKWLKEEKAECPVCRFKLRSKEIRRETPGVEQWNDDRNEMASARAVLASNLRRLNFPTVNIHPFGPTSHRIANIVHEDDDHADMMRSLARTFSGPSVFDNIVNSHTSGGSNSYPSIISNITSINNVITDSNYNYRVSDMTSNSTNIYPNPLQQLVFSSLVYDMPASYENNRSVTSQNETDLSSDEDDHESVSQLHNNESSALQDNQNTSDNSNNHME